MSYDIVVGLSNASFLTFFSEEAPYDYNIKNRMPTTIFHLIREGGREAKLSELYKADRYIRRWRRKLKPLSTEDYTKGQSQRVHTKEDVTLEGERGGGGAYKGTESPVLYTDMWPQN